MGLTFKLDVGLYRLNQQVACQRYRQNPIDAKSTDRVSELSKEMIASLRATFNPQTAYAQAA